ncbi:MAG: DUF63 family protein [Halolamina sp.]
MSTVARRLGFSTEQLWGGSVLALLAALVGGSVVAPETVYDGFLWQYFWGPVQADANSAVCAIRPGSTVEYLYSQSACRAAAEPVAYPGYTLVSEVGYVLTLLLALSGVVFMLDRLELGNSRDFYFALVPFMLFGGALRVVEDATDTAGSGLLTYPLNTLVISPVIYFTVFFITLAGVLLAVGLARRGVTGELYRPLAGLGTLTLAATLGYLLVRALAPTDPVTFNPQVLGVVVVGATATAAATWKLLAEYVPRTVVGRPKVAFVVLWAHAVDGTANVVGLDWMPALGAGRNLVPKHPVNLAVVNFTESVLPPSVLAVTGDAWPFLLVKLAAASFVVSVFEPEMFEESPRYTILLLIAVTAVGLGPGTRDVLRATFGV